MATKVWENFMYTIKIHKSNNLGLNWDQHLHSRLSLLVSEKWLLQLKEKPFSKALNTWQKR